MPTADQPTPCDTCDGMLVNVNPPGGDDRRQRFLNAYGLRLAIAPAARLAGVHRATVHRWMADPAFADAMQAAADDFFRRARAEAEAAQAIRRQWRAERERARRPMRCYYLAKARAAKRR